MLFLCCPFARFPAVMFPDDLPACCHAAAAILLPAQVTGHHMIFPDRVIACRAGHQAMGADILLAILAALADMILTIGLFTDTAGYGMILYISICYNHCTGYHGQCRTCRRILHTQRYFSS